MPVCDFHFCSNPAEVNGLCRSCWNDEQECINGTCGCCFDEGPEYLTADVAYDMRGGATSDYEWYGGYME